MDDATTTLDTPLDETVVDAPTETLDAADAVEEELLIEEVSIDGMCGVY